ncbi:hypothetical protein [Streptomyces kronopolitis]|uniref:hypothetical protein n=1 Tax=Streptomyces kronopolitis TaxID=1612435 RepID=UPI00343CFD23
MRSLRRTSIRFARRCSRLQGFAGLLPAQLPPPLPWSYATATLTATGATPGAVITFRSGGASGPVLCTAVADRNGNVTCKGVINPVQSGLGYTATTPVPGGFLTASNIFMLCL